MSSYSSASASSCASIDDSLGPYALNCRGGFDFTLVFEEAILTILPFAILLFVTPLRVLYLHTERSKVVQSRLLLFKLVSTVSTCLTKLQTVRAMSMLLQSLTLMLHHQGFLHHIRHSAASTPGPVGTIFNIQDSCIGAHRRSISSRLTRSLFPVVHRARPYSSAFRSSQRLSFHHPSF